MHLLLATGNRGKIQEMRGALDGLGLTLLNLADVQVIGEPDESGKTYAENALIKARHAFEQVTLPTIADDSGIHVEALEDELGVRTRRWGAGQNATDEEWITYFLDRMKREPNKRARFVCAIAHINADGREHTFEGVCDGVITDELEAEYLPGLPLSACFRPNGYDRVFSALTLEQKNSTSHRGRALMSMRRFLEGGRNK